VAAAAAAVVVVEEEEEEEQEEEEERSLKRSRTANYFLFIFENVTKSHDLKARGLIIFISITGTNTALQIVHDQHPSSPKRNK
jgi:hypothetical protein